MITKEDCETICRFIDESKTLLQTSVYGNQLVITGPNAEELKRKVRDMAK